MQETLLTGSIKCSMLFMRHNQITLPHLTVGGGTNSIFEQISPAPIILGSIFITVSPKIDPCTLPFRRFRQISLTYASY